MRATITEPRDYPRPTMKNMKVGQLAQIQDDTLPQYNGMIVLYGGAGIISLTDPATTWTTWARQQLPPIRVRLLPVGTEVTLTQETVDEQQ